MTQNTDNYGLNGDFKFSLNQGAINNEGKLGKSFSGYWIFHKDTDILADNQWTISCWMKAGSFGPNNDILMCKNNDSSEACQYYMSIINGKTFNLGINSGSSFAQYAYTFSVGVWYHLAATFDGSNYKMYINGEIVKSGTCNNKYILCSNIGLGCRSTNSAGTSLTGSTDKYYNDFRIYDHCLSPNEIKLISQGLVLHYPMGSIDGKIAGRNLLRKPTTENGSLFGSMSELKTKTFSGWDFYGEKPLVDIDWNNHVGEYLTYRCYVENVSQTLGTGTGIMLHFFYTDNTYTQYGGGKNGVINSFLTVGEKGYLTITAQIPDPSIRSNPTTIKNVHVSIRHNSTDGNSTVNFKEAKVELSNKPTPWTPAPEDVPQWYNNIIYDTSGYMNNGTVTDAAAPSWNKDSPRYSGCYDFDGVDDYISLNTIIPTKGFTLSLWLNFKEIKNSGQFIVDLRDLSGSGIQPLYINSDGKIQFYTNNGTNFYFNYTFTAHKWYYIALALTNTTVSLYVNGTLSETNSCSPPDTISLINIARRYAESSGRLFHGLISDFRIYTTTLSTSDIEFLYKTSASVTKNGTLLLAGEVVE